MNIGQRTLTIVGICSIAGIADAGEIHFEDPAIISPFANSQVEVFWVGSDAGYTGELNWINPGVAASPVALWTNKSASPGDSYILPKLYGFGERVDFSYEIIHGSYDFFSTANEQDWSQFVVDASNPLDVLVGIEDIRYPGGDMDHNDSVFRVVFTEGVVPAPGAMALLGGGCLMMLRRKR